MKGKNVFIDKSIALYKAREEKPKRKSMLNRQRLGILLYPYSKEETVRVSMGDMCNGRMKKFRMEWISIIIEKLGVDSNFLFGYPSVFDEEYERLCPDNQAT